MHSLPFYVKALLLDISPLIIIYILGEISIRISKLYFKHRIIQFFILIILLILNYFIYVAFLNIMTLYNLNIIEFVTNSQNKNMVKYALLIVYFISIFFFAIVYIWKLYRPFFKKVEYSFFPKLKDINIILKSLLLLLFLFTASYFLRYILNGRIHPSIAESSIGLLLSVPAAIIEELVFRFWLYFFIFFMLTNIFKIKENGARVVSILVMSVLFSLLHGGDHIMIFMASILFYITMEETKSIGASVIIHYLYNTIISVLFWLQNR